MNNGGAVFMAKDKTLGGRKGLSQRQIERRTMSKEDLLKWTEQSEISKIKYKHYWETEEHMVLTHSGDEYLIFVGKTTELTAKIWNIMDTVVPHTIYILRNEPECRYDLSEKEGLLLHFVFKDRCRIMNSEKLLLELEGAELTVYRKMDDIIVKIDERPSVI